MSHKNIILSGPYSTAGKLSLNYYNIIAKRNFLKRKAKRLIHKNLLIHNCYPRLFNDDDLSYFRNQTFKLKKFTEDDISIKSISNDSIHKNNFDNYNDYEYDNNNEIEKNKNFLGDNYKFYKLHKERIKSEKKEGKKRNKNDYSYTPGLYDFNYTYFYKVKSGVEWKNLTGRDSKINSQEKFDLNISKIKDQRNDRICNKNLDTQNKINKFFENKNKQKSLIDKTKLQNKKMIKYFRNTSKVKNLSKNLTKIISDISISPFNNIDKKSNKIKKRLSPQTTSPTKIKLNLAKKKMGSSKIYRSTIDFKKCLSREYISNYKINHERKRICVVNPNYNSVEGKAKMLVLYKNESKKNNKNKINEFKGINLSDLYDFNKCYEKIYGNKLNKVPKFEKMISRPNDDKLPSYMKGIYNGMSSCISTEKSLILNNYSGQKFNDNIRKNKKLINKFLGNKNEIKKDQSKEILQKFNNLYINFYRALNANKNKRK